MLLSLAGATHKSAPPLKLLASCLFTIRLQPGLQPRPRSIIAGSTAHGLKHAATARISRLGHEGFLHTLEPRLGSQGAAPAFSAALVLGLAGVRIAAGAKLDGH